MKSSPGRSRGKFTLPPGIAAAEVAIPVQKFATLPFQRFTCWRSSGSGESRAASKASAIRANTGKPISGLARIETGEKNPKCHAVRGTEPTLAAVEAPSAVATHWRIFNQRVRHQP